MIQTAYIFNNRLYCITKGDTCEGAQFGDILRFPLFLPGSPLTFTFIESLFIGTAKVVFMRQKPGPPLITVDIKTFHINSQTIKKEEHEQD